MTRIQPLTPPGIAHRPQPIAFASACPHCFCIIGSPRSSAERKELQALHICSEKLLSLRPDAPVPFN